MKNKLRLYLVTDQTLSLGRPLEDIIVNAVAGGVTMVQLREKNAPTGEFVNLAKRVMAVLKPLGIPLIINDRVDVALAVDADGVHIGQSDMSYEDARRLIGNDKIIGLSVENLKDIEIANNLDVDYIGISPVYSTSTKTDTAKPFGLKGLKEAVMLSKHPTVAIGGMNHETAGDVILTGCNGIAVVSAICSADSPQNAATELKHIIDLNSKSSWSQQVWDKSKNIYLKILEQKFINELADGTLDIERFANYIAQDEHYLKDYYNNMLKLANMMDTPENKELFTSFAQAGMEGENIMHQFLINKYGIETNVEASEITLGYNSHIQSAINSGDRRLAFAAMLPCMWIYNQVGLHIIKISKTEDNPYKEWIAEYGNDVFTTGVNSVLKIIDDWADYADDDTKNTMNDYYLKSALYEYAFWDYGYYGNTKSYDYIDNLDSWI